MRRRRTEKDLQDTIYVGIPLLKTYNRNSDDIPLFNSSYKFHTRSTQNKLNTIEGSIWKFKVTMTDLGRLRARGMTLRVHWKDSGQKKDIIRVLPQDIETDGLYVKLTLNHFFVWQELFGVSDGNAKNGDWIRIDIRPSDTTRDEFYASTPFFQIFDCSKEEEVFCDRWLTLYVDLPEFEDFDIKLFNIPTAPTYGHPYFKVEEEKKKIGTEECIYKRTSKAYIPLMFECDSLTALAFQFYPFMKVVTFYDRYTYNDYFCGYTIKECDVKATKTPFKSLVTLTLQMQSPYTIDGEIGELINE